MNLKTNLKKKEQSKSGTHFKREKLREERSKTSGAGCTDVYYSTWKHYNQMDFLDVTTSIDYTSLDTEPYIPPKRKKQNEKREKHEKLEEWKSLAQSLKSHKLQESVPKGETTTREKANSFGMVVADTFLQSMISKSGFT